MIQKRVMKRLTQIERKLAKGIKDKRRREDFELIRQILKWVLEGGEY